MQLSHDESVCFASSKGFWRANSERASNSGMAMPVGDGQEQDGSRQAVPTSGGGEGKERVNCDATPATRLG